ncbi:OBAP family protein [Pseudomonas sp. NPDC088368]|uniref:OBAP family protein n=1 Tax=Pseudomonas sp. NPDC088368 TaxID=3364453 RepID=UPI0037FB963C
MHTQRSSSAKLTFLATGLTSLMACSTHRSPSPVESPGKPATPMTRALETGADILQSHAPVDQLNAYLDGFHFYNGNRQAQMEAHHYCSVLNEEVIQCAIFDGNTKDAKLMGVEYIISAALFAQLPDEEKALWHSHKHEVKSGQLIAPGIPEPAEHALMEKLVNTYGKTWHTWHTDQDKTLPLGVPQLMMGFTADGQANPRLIGERDHRFGISSEANRTARADILAPDPLPEADAWRHGKVIQINDPTGTSHTVHPQSAQ